MHHDCQRILSLQYLRPLEDPATVVLALEIGELFKRELADRDTFSCEIGFVDIELSTEQDHVTEELIFGSNEVPWNEFVTG